MFSVYRGLYCATLGLDFWRLLMQQPTDMELTLEELGCVKCMCCINRYSVRGRRRKLGRIYEGANP